MKPIFPKDGETSGACATNGSASGVTVWRLVAKVGGLLRAAVVAEAGKAREATMAPEITITAEALVAGLAEREMADDRDAAEFRWRRARWRPR